MEWEFTLRRYAGGWSWTARSIGAYGSYSGWTVTKFGASRKMRRLAKRVAKERTFKEVWTEKVFQ